MMIVTTAGMTTPTGGMATGTTDAGASCTMMTMMIGQAVMLGFLYAVAIRSFASCAATGNPRKRASMLPCERLIVCKRSLVREPLRWHLRNRKARLVAG
jgi:hypothetical protein